MKTLAYSTLTALGVSAVSYAQQGLARVGCAVACMCYQLVNVLPIVSMLMIIGGGIVYAAGMMMGAETRGRATTWAQAMLIGAIIGILIVVVAPAVLQILYNPNKGVEIVGSGNAGGICIAFPPTGMTCTGATC